MSQETFKRNCRGWARSSDGYAVRLLGRNNLQYVDEHGELSTFAEPMSKPRTDIVVETSAIPDLPERSREEVVARLRRVFGYRGWTFIEADG